MKNKTLMNYYSVVSAFSADYYDDLITKNHLSEEISITVDGKKMFIYPVRYKGKLYAVSSDIVEAGKLPIKIKKTKKFAFRSTVYHLITNFASARITPTKTKTWRQLIQILGNFKHTNDLHFKLYKIVFLMLYLRKGFCRIATTASFGKNSIPGIVKTLMTDIAIINPRSTAAFEHRLINDTIILDELTNLVSSQTEFMEQLLLQIGDWSVTYEKGTRGTSKYGGKDEYDISNLSVISMFNIYEYYLNTKSKGEKYFDKIFQEAVLTRYCPFVFEGILDASQFEELRKPETVAKECKDDLIDLIKNIKYYKENLEKYIKPYKLNKEYKLAAHGRFDKSFKVICMGINLYANDEKEYQDMVEELYQCHLRYDDMFKMERVEEVPLDEPIKNIKQQSLENF